MEFPVGRIAEPRTVRLVPSARLRDPVLKQLADDDATLHGLEEIEGATSGRLNAQERGAEDIDPREFVHGIAHAHFVNAAFAYWRPKDLNRFNGPGRGAWYASLRLETCIREVSYHMNRELGRINDYDAVIDYAEMFAGFAGDFVDLRKVSPRPACLNPDPDVGYPEGNILARRTRDAGYNGIVYPSVRHEGGTCLVSLRPQAVQSVVQGNIIRLTWAGNSDYKVEILKSRRTGT